MSHFERALQDIQQTLKDWEILCSSLIIHSTKLNERIHELEETLEWVIEQRKQTAHPTVVEIINHCQQALEGKNANS